MRKTPTRKCVIILDCNLNNFKKVIIKFFRDFILVFLETHLPKRFELMIFSLRQCILLRRIPLLNILPVLFFGKGIIFKKLKTPYGCFGSYEWHRLERVVLANETYQIYVGPTWSNSSLLKIIIYNYPTLVLNFFDPKWQKFYIRMWVMVLYAIRLILVNILQNIKIPTIVHTFFSWLLKRLILSNLLISHKLGINSCLRNQGGSEYGDCEFKSQH